MALFLNDGPKDEPDVFPNSAIDSNIDESLKHMKTASRLDDGYDYSGAADAAAATAAKGLKIFTDDDTLLFVRCLEFARNQINQDRLAALINETFNHLNWPRFVELRAGDDLPKKIKSKLRSLRQAAKPGHASTYVDGWFNQAEQELKIRIDELHKASPRELSLAAVGTGSNKRLRYTDSEETMFRHWMIQGKRRNYIYNAYRKTRSKESIIHKMKSVRKQFSRPNPIPGHEHVKLYNENDKGHFDPDQPDYCVMGPIPEQDLINFQDRINELIKTRTLLDIAQPDDDDEDPFKTGSTSIDLNLLRNYVLMANKVQNEFSKVEHHVLTADDSWVEAANTVRRACQLVENALSLTKHRAGHELDDVISAEDLTALLDQGPMQGGMGEVMDPALNQGMPQGIDRETESVLNMMRGDPSASAAKRRKR